MNVFDAIARYGHDEDFMPRSRPEPTEHGPGSLGKLIELTRRVELGQVLHVPEDNRIAGTVQQQTVCAQYVQAEARRVRQASALKGTRTNLSRPSNEAKREKRRLLDQRKMESVA